MTIPTERNSPATYLVVLVLSVFCTLAYWVGAWHVSMQWNTLILNPGTAGGLAAFATRPLSLGPEFAMLHWQLAALLSLVLNAWWAFRRAGRGLDITLPVACHLTWIVAAFMLHVAGGLSSFITFAYTLD